VRIGTVRRPPCGVPKSDCATRDFYDIWLPDLAPSAPLVKLALAATTDAEWLAFEKRYRTEMRRPENARLLDLLAAFSQTTRFSVGCYCELESRCHRSTLRTLLAERGAKLEA